MVSEQLNQIGNRLGRTQGHVCKTRPISAFNWTRKELQLIMVYFYWWLSPFAAVAIRTGVIYNCNYKILITFNVNADGCRRVAFVMRWEYDRIRIFFCLNSFYAGQSTARSTQPIRERPSHTLPQALRSADKFQKPKYDVSYLSWI